jgi:hypothetical protein
LKFSDLLKSEVLTEEKDHAIALPVPGFISARVVAASEGFLLHTLSRCTFPAGYFQALTWAAC